MPNYTNRYKNNDAAAERLAAGLQLRRVELAEQAAADREGLSLQDLELRRAKEAFDQKVKAAEMFQKMQTLKDASSALDVLANLKPEDPDAMGIATAAIARFPLAAGHEMITKQYGLLAAAHQTANEAAAKTATELGVDARSPDFQITDPKTGRWVGRDWNKYGQAVTAAKAQKNAQATDALLKLGGGSGRVSVKQGDATVTFDAKSELDRASENAEILSETNQGELAHSGNATQAQRDINLAKRRDAESKAAAAQAGTRARNAKAAADIMASVAAFKEKTNAKADDPMVVNLLKAAKAMLDSGGDPEEPSAPAAQPAQGARVVPPSAQEQIDFLNGLAK